MKKLLLLIFIFCAAKSFAQFPINAATGTPTTTVLTRGISAADSGFWYRTAFADTTALNRGRIDEIAGVLVRTSSNELWLRNNTATGWIQVSGGSGSVNIYNSNGTQTGNRVVTGGGYTLAFDAQSSIRFQPSGSNRTGLLYMDIDSVRLEPPFGIFTIDSLASGASTDSVLVWTQATGRVKKRSYSSFTPTWQQVLTAGSTLTGNNTIAGGGFDFTHNNIGLHTIVTNTGFDYYLGATSRLQIGGAGSSLASPNGASYFQALNNSLRLQSTATTGTTTTSAIYSPLTITSGTGYEIVTTSLTSGTLVNITSTSTALAANNEGLNIGISGANATNGITATGARISVTNTNATSGTNNALDLTASGATTANNALNIAAGAIALNGSAGTSGQVLTSAGANTLPTWSTPSSGITIGTTTITSGTNTRILYNNSGVVGEYTLTGSGTTVAMQASPSFTGNVGIAQGTITTDVKALDISTTWNAAGVAFTGLKLDVTNTASAATSKMIAVTQGLGAGFWVDKNGQTEILTNSGVVGYGSQGLKLRDYSSGAAVVLQTTATGSLYITNGAGTASSLTLGTRANPDDATTFIASSGRWIINSGAFVVNRSTWLGTTQNEVLSTSIPQYGGFYDGSNYFTLAASSAGVMTIAPTGASVTVTKPVVLKNYTVATLPTGVQGMICYVTDATAPTYGATLVGGGAVVTIAFFDGTNWTAH